MSSLTSYPPTSPSQSAQLRKAERLKGKGIKFVLVPPLKRRFLPLAAKCTAEWRPGSLDHWELMCGRSIYRNHGMSFYNLKLEIKGRPDVMVQASNPRLGSEGSWGYQAIPNMPGFVSKHRKQINKWSELIIFCAPREHGALCPGRAKSSLLFKFMDQNGSSQPSHTTPP